MKHNLFEDELPALLAHLPTGGQYRSRYAWYAAGLKIVAALGMSFMSRDLDSDVLGILSCAVSMLMGTSLGQDVIRLCSYLRTSRAKFLEYRVKHDAWMYRSKHNVSVYVSWYPGNEHVSIARHPGRNDYVFLSVTFRPRKPFVHFVKDRLPF